MGASNSLRLCGCAGREHQEGWIFGNDLGSCPCSIQLPSFTTVQGNFVIQSDGTVWQIIAETKNGRGVFSLLRNFTHHFDS